jgi:hypothetical protein
MRQKFLELVAAANAGIPSQIVLFTQLAGALEGKAVGTKISAAARAFDKNIL